MLILSGLFDILFDVEKQLDMTGYDEYKSKEYMAYSRDGFKSMD